MRSFFRSSPHRRGIFFADAVVGIALLAAAGLVLATAESRYLKLDHAATDHRAAGRLAERYLTEIVATGHAQAVGTDETVTVVPLSTAAPAGWTWVSVTTTVHGRRAELIGLVPRRTL